MLLFNINVLNPLFSFVQLCLKFFIMFEIFSNRLGSNKALLLSVLSWPSSLFSPLLEHITRKVVLSKRIISSAFITPLNFFKLLWWLDILGISEHTICDHALYKLSSQIEVGKPIRLGNPNSEDVSLRFLIMIWNSSSLLSS